MRVRVVDITAVAVGTILGIAGVCAGGPLGMKVSPGGALIQNVTPGVPEELSFPITVMNDDDQPHDVTFAALQPAKGKFNVPSGYADIPDVSWVRFSQTEVNVPAKGHAAVKMTLAVPAGDEYRDQHWSVTVAVRSKPAEKQMIALALYPRFEIETVPSGAALGRSAETQPKAPYGDVAVTPGAVTFAPGVKPGTAQLTVWNNTDKPWQGDVAVIADADSAKKERLAVSTGRQWPPEAKCVELSATTLEIAARDKRTLDVSMTLPPGGGEGLPCEAILLLKGRDAPGALVRLRCDAATRN